MIKTQEPLSMPEVLEYVEKDNKKAEIVGFLKKFTKMKSRDAEAMKKKFSALDLLKLREEHIVRIIDLMPETAEELNKIFVDVNLDEDEAKKILEIVEEFK